MYRKNIIDETNIINNQERNLLEENLREKHVRTTDSVDFIRSDHLIDESVSSSDLANQIIVTEDVKSRKDKVVAVIYANYFLLFLLFLILEANRQNISE